MKFNQPEEIKRLAIFFFYDRDGIVDDYIPNLLEDLNKNVSELLIVCNGNLSIDGMAKLSELTSHILVRENRGYYVWAYKAGLEYYGWEKLGGYDEVILINFTNMGPVYPFKDMFDEMSKRDVDFWGITRRHGMDLDPWGRCKYGYIPMHIQSAFLVIRSSMIKSIEFQHYWEDMPMINDFAEAIFCHEVIFTEDFSRKGFSSDVYVNTDDLKEYIDYPLMLYPKELIANRKCPVFKRKTFSNHYEEFLDVSCGQSGYELYKYLANNTDYDLNYIWDTILRTANMSDIKERMQLNYILPSGVRLPNEKDRPRVALFMHIYYMDLVEYCKRYAASMPIDADIYLATDTEEKKLILEKAFGVFDGRKVKIVMVKNRGREISSHFIELKPFVSQYDYICFAHDKKTLHLKPYMKGESFSYHCFENVLAGPIFVENIIATFQNNPRLGMLVPPTPIHSDFNIVIGDEWQKNFKNVCTLADRLEIKVNIDKDKPPIAPLGGVYWYKSEALKILFDANFQYEDFPTEPVQDLDGTIMHAIERIYPFAAQQAGYYTGWVLSDEFSKMELTNLNKILSDFNRVLLWKFGPKTRYEHMNLISKSSISPVEPENILKAAEKEEELQMLLSQVKEKEKTIKALKGQVAEKEQANPALTGQMVEKEQAIRALTRQIDEKEQTIQVLLAQVAEKEQAMLSLSAQVAEKEQAMLSLSAQVAEKEQAMQALTRQVAGKEEAVKALSGRIAKKEQAVLSLSAQVSEKDQMVQELREQLDQTKHDLEWIRTVVNGYAQSTSWKITKPLRMIKDIFHLKK